MNEYAPIVEAIKARVTMQDVITRYAPNPTPRHRRIPCPIHNGDNFNLHFSDNLYHCFVCGEGGDVISFVRHIYKLDFLDALRKLNDDFGLSLPIDRKPTLSEQREAERRQREIAEQREAEQHSKAYDLEQYNRLLCFKSWLCVQNHTEAVTHDLQYVQRLLEQSVSTPITYDVTVRVEALLSKHNNADTFKWFWKDENQSFPTYKQFYRALYDGLML